ADACLMIGESYDKLGQGEKARAFFSRVVKDYPNSEAARRAGYRLAPR
ncbi:tetratricopeptide repeat protein, partial [bacterium]